MDDQKFFREFVQQIFFISWKAFGGIPLWVSSKALPSIFTMTIVPEITWTVSVKLRFLTHSGNLFNDSAKKFFWNAPKKLFVNFSRMGFGIPSRISIGKISRNSINNLFGNKKKTFKNKLLQLCWVTSEEIPGAISWDYFGRICRRTPWKILPKYRNFSAEFLEISKLVTPD